MPPVTNIDVSKALLETRAVWNSFGWRRHALAVLAILATLTLTFRISILSPEPLGDEIIHEIAYQLETSGRSPYDDSDYVYPPSLLRIQSAARALFASTPAFLPLRVASLLGLAFLLWCSAAWIGGEFRYRLLVVLSYAVLAPGVGLGIEFGNLSFAVGGLILGALLAWDRRPAASGLLLAASLLVKPLAPAAAVTLFCERSSSRWKNLLRAAIPLALAALLLCFDPELGPFLRQGSTPWVLESTASLHRFLVLGGVRGLATATTVLLLAVTALVARRFVHDLTSRCAVALAACVMVTPVVWNHTLVLTAPLQAMAVTLATRRYRSAGIATRRWRGWEATGIALAVAALVFSAGATGIDDQSLSLQIAGSIPPAIAPAVLAAYVLAFHRPQGAPAAAARRFG